MGTDEAAISSPLLQPILDTLGPDVLNAIQSSRILLVGSGGIGCEVLKNLALSGFTKIDVIDLDTIDVSNLNRQFLFRSHHVGKSKCDVAVEAAKRMAVQKVDYKAHHGNVKDRERFDVNFFKQFNIVMNALDNVDARRHVNRICLAANVPLVEAGTTGYLGQVTVIHKESDVECFECQPKPAQKVYPICTIRSTPSMPVHTIVWGKELYKLLFGSKVDNSMLFEDDAITESEDEKSVYMDLVLELRKQHQDSKDNKITETEVKVHASKILTALYNTEVTKQIKMDRYKTSKKKPEPLPLELIQEGTGYNPDTKESSKISPPTHSPSYKYTQTWSPKDCVLEFTQCFLDVFLSDTPTFDEFDKDDSLAIRLVTAASNLRSHIFGIEPLQSIYSAKGIAGNIIPAIATTNAIVSGLQVLQVFHILKLQHESPKIDVKTKCKYMYVLRDKTRKGFYIQPTNLPPPNHKCFVCRGAKIDVQIDVTQWNLQDFVAKVIKKRLGFVEPTILLGDGDIIHEEGEGADAASYAVNQPKKLQDLPAGGIKGGSMVQIEDFYQNLEVEINIIQRDEWDEEKEPDGFFIGGEIPVAAAESNEGATDGATSEKKDDEDDDVVMMVDEPEEPSKKRSRDDDEKEENYEYRAKKMKTDDSVLVIDD